MKQQLTTASEKKLSIGDIITVYGQKCRIYRVYDFGTYDVETLDGTRCYRVTGLYCPA
jgi:hypothetical protein